MTIEMWAVAAVAVVDALGRPLLLRTFTSPPNVLQSPEAPQQAHLYVGPEDIVKMHFLVFSSLDRCDELWEAQRQRSSAAAASSSRSSAASSAAVARRAARAGAGARRSVTESATAPPKALPPTASATGTAAAPPPPLSSSFAGAAAATTAGAQPPKAPISAAADARFLGRLIYGHRFQSHGFCSATGVRTLLVTVGSDAPPDAVLPLCRAIYEAASAALTNPFRTPRLCWERQRAVLARGYAHLAAQDMQARAAPGDGVVEAGSYGAAAAVRGMAAPMHMGVAGVHEGGLSGAAPHQQSTLALSASFNTQLESILSTLTATAQSCIMH